MADCRIVFYKGCYLVLLYFKMLQIQNLLRSFEVMRVRRIVSSLRLNRRSSLLSQMAVLCLPLLISVSIGSTNSSICKNLPELLIFNDVPSSYDLVVYIFDTVITPNVELLYNFISFALIFMKF